MTRAALALVVVALVAGPAAADKKAAEKFFRMGEKAYRAQNFDAAAVAFDEAYKALELPEIAFSAAQAHRRQYHVDSKPQHVKRALELYKLYLGAVKTGGRVKDAADAIGELQPEYDKLAAAGKLGAAAAAALTRLGVGVTFSDAADRPMEGMHEIDDRNMTAPAVAVHTQIDDAQVEPNMLVAVEPGPHVIRVSADGYASAEKKVTAVAASSEIVPIELSPKPAMVTVHTEPGARLTIDSRVVGSAPHAAIELAPGRHLLAIARDGRVTAGRDLVVTRGQQLAVDVALEKSTRRKMVPYFLVGSGVALALTGAAGLGALHFDHVASSDLSTLRHTGDQSPSSTLLGDYYTARDRRNMMVDAMWVTGGVTVAAAALTAWLYYFDTPSGEGVRVAPVVAPTAGGAAIAGHF